MKIEEFKQELLRSSVCTQGLFRKLIVPVCQKFELTLQQLFILGCLYQEDNQTPRQISEQIGVSPNNFSSICKKLEANGWVERIVNEADKRASVLHLTVDGRRLIREMEQDMEQRYGAIFEQVPKETFRKIREGLDALYDLSLRI